MRKRVFSIVLCLCLLLLGVGPVSALDFTPIPQLPDINLTPLTADVSGDFKDANFKKAVWEWLGNTGTPGKISIQDIRNRLTDKNYTFYAIEKGIKSLDGIRYFAGLEALVCYKNEIKNLDEIPSTLTYLDCSFNEIEVLPDPLPPDLELLNCNNNESITYIPELPDTLEYLYCSSNKIKTLPKLPAKLMQLACMDNSIEELPKLPQLLSLMAGMNRITEIASLPSSLEILSCYDNQLRSLPELPSKLKQLDCHKNYLTKIPKLPNSVESFNVSYNFLGSKAVGQYMQTGSNVIKPQYALHYSGDKVELDKNGTSQIKSSDLKIRMTSDFIVWGDVETVDLSKLTFTSSNNGIAKVDSTGLITGVSEGTCEITVKYYGMDDESTTVAIPVTVSNKLVLEDIPIVIPGQEESGVDFMSASSWAIPELEAAEQLGLFTDKVKRNLKQDITREEFCSIAVKLYEALTGSQAAPSLSNPFQDTSDADVLKAYELGVVNGITANTFAPDKKITRQEICVMIVRALKAADPDLNVAVSGVGPFTDESQIASWAIQEVRFSSHNNIMKGVGENRIDPLSNTSREQGVILIKRTYEKFN